MEQKIPACDLKRQISLIRPELDAAISRVITSGKFIFGEEIELLEREVAAYSGLGYAIGVSNGTDALRLSLLALGVKPGEAVACPAFTYYATAGAVAAIGAIPVFTDINPSTYTMCPQSLEYALMKKRRRAKIKAIIPVHLYGQCADMDPIAKLAKKNKLRVLEDNAQSFGAEYKGRKAGSLADCAAVSFFPAKNLGACGDAGMVLTHSRAIEAKVRLLRNQGNKEKYFHLVLGHNNRLDTIQAAVLRVKLPHLDLWSKKRQENAAYYNQGLQGLNVKTPFVAPYSTHVYHQYVLRMKGSSKMLIEHLRQKGIDTRVYYPVPLHLQPCFKYLGYKRGDFPESEKASKETLAIPVYPELTKDEMGYIIASIKEFAQ